MWWLSWCPDREKAGGILIGAGILAGIGLLSQYSYLLFHSLAEFFSIIVAACTFMIAWNVRRLLDNGFFLFLGIAVMAAAGIDLVHTLAYKGMGVFPGDDANLPTQLWIAARYLQAGSFLIAPRFLGRRLEGGKTLLAYAVVTFLLLASIVSGAFPTCYVEGTGLTRFKVVSEYVISLMFLAALAILLRMRGALHADIWRMLALAIVLTVGSELAFTLYVGVYELPNMIGHLLKILAFYCIYRAMVRTSLADPFSLLFRDLRQSEEVLQARTRQIEAVRVVATEITRELDLDRLLSMIVERAMALLRADRSTIRLWDERRQLLDGAVSCGVPRVTSPPLRLDEGVSGVVARRREGLIVNDYGAFAQGILEPESPTPPTAATGYPLLYHDRLIGVITASHHMPGKTFSEADLGILRLFADQAAIAIENARLYEEFSAHATDLETRVKERTAELEQALQVKEEFLARMSHEFRTPLNFILGFSDLLGRGKAGPLTTTQAHYVERIQTGGRQILDLVQNLLDLTAAGIDREPLRLERVIVASLARESLESRATEVAQKRLAVICEIPEGLVHAADRARLGQVLRLLIGNAVKFTPEGGTITVAARMVPAGAQGSRGAGEPGAPQPPPLRSAVRGGASPAAPLQLLEIAVTDTGIGFPPEDMERIFSTFAQLDEAPGRARGGAGLGLAVVRTLVERLGGCVWAESDGPGCGARFVVRVPGQEFDRTLRVLVVEDEPTLLKTVTVFLRDVGYEVVGAGTAGAALEALATGPPDLVILDLGLPDQSGEVVLKTMRASEALCAVPVLVMTGLGEAQAETAMAAGADEFLTKPFSLTVLMRVVAELLQGRAARARSDAPTAIEEGTQ